MLGDGLLPPGIVEKIPTPSPDALGLFAMG